MRTPREQAGSTPTVSITGQRHWNVRRQKRIYDLKFWTGNIPGRRGRFLPRPNLIPVGSKTRLSLGMQHSKERFGKASTDKTSVSDENIFTVPLKVEDVADCYFYHTMALPGYGVIEGRDWDLRGGVDEYLGKVDFDGQRVLEIGPASGFLTFEMEKRGAEVVSVEVTEEHGWDYVPYPAKRLEEVIGPRRIVMQQLKNSYWLSHSALQSKARVYYGDVYNLPESLGQFDIAVMGSVLLHCRDPLRIVEQCWKIAGNLIIVELLHTEL